MSKSDQLLKELYDAITTEEDMEVLNAVIANVGKHLKSIEKKVSSTGGKICYECYATLDENGQCPTKMCRGY